VIQNNISSGNTGIGFNDKGSGNARFVSNTAIANGTDYAVANVLTSSPPLISDGYWANAVLP